MFRRDRKTNFKSALKKALQSIKDQNKSTNTYYTILHEPRLIPTKDIQQALIECGEEEENIILHPQKTLNHSLEPLKQYLKDSIGIYLVPQHNFVGMESKCIILGGRN